MRKIFRLFKLLKCLKSNNTRCFYKISEGKWVLEALITDKDAIKLLRKELGK